MLTLDFLGSAIRARRDADPTPSLLEDAGSAGARRQGEFTVFGDAKTWTPAVAALLKGALGHSLDFDDTHADSWLHPSAPVVPAAFAVGELVGGSGRDVLTAIVAGYAVCCRLGDALDPTSQYARGFHPPRPPAPMARPRRPPGCLDCRRSRSFAAFGVSGSLAAGSLQFLVNGAGTRLPGRRRRDERRDRGDVGAQRFHRRERNRSRASMAPSSTTATTASRQGGRRPRRHLRRP